MNFLVSKTGGICFSIVALLSAMECVDIEEYANNIKFRIFRPDDTRDTTPVLSQFNIPLESQGCPRTANSECAAM